MSADDRPGLPGRSLAGERRRATDADVSEPCPWCGKPILVRNFVVDHSVETPAGPAPLATLHAVCSEDQQHHEETFG